MVFHSFKYATTTLCLKTVSSFYYERSCCAIPMSPRLPLHKYKDASRGAKAGPWLMRTFHVTRQPRAVDSRGTDLRSSHAHWKHVPGNITDDQGAISR